MSGGRIQAVAVTLLGENERPVARGVVPIDAEEGSPPAIFWEGELYIRLVANASLYQKSRAMFAGAGFHAVTR